jgi:hypothetical protein
MRTLFQGIKGEGKVFWDGRNRSGENLSSGIYLGALRAGGKLFWLKLILLR